MVPDDLGRPLPERCAVLVQAHQPPGGRRAVERALTRGQEAAPGMARDGLQGVVVLAAIRTSPDGLAGAVDLDDQSVMRRSPTGPHAARHHGAAVLQGERVDPRLAGAAVDIQRGAPDQLAVAADAQHLDRGLAARPARRAGHTPGAVGVDHQVLGTGIQPALIVLSGPDGLAVGVGQAQPGVRPVGGITTEDQRDKQSSVGQFEHPIRLHVAGAALGHIGQLHGPDQLAPGVDPAQQGATIGLVLRAPERVHSAALGGCDRIQPLGGPLQPGQRVLRHVQAPLSAQWDALPLLTGGDLGAAAQLADQAAGLQVLAAADGLAEVRRAGRAVVAGAGLLAGAAPRGLAAGVAPGVGTQEHAGHALAVQIVEDAFAGHCDQTLTGDGDRPAAIRATAVEAAIPLLVADAICAHQPEVLVAACGVVAPGEHQPAARGGCQVIYLHIGHAATLPLRQAEFIDAHQPEARLALVHRPPAGRGETAVRLGDQ